MGPAVERDPRDHTRTLRVLPDPAVTSTVFLAKVMPKCFCALQASEMVSLLHCEQERGRESMSLPAWGRSHPNAALRCLLLERTAGGAGSAGPAPGRGTAHGTCRYLLNNAQGTDVFLRRLT